MEQETKFKKLYEKKGQIQGSVGAIISLIVGVGVGVLVLIFVGVLGGQTYNIAQSDIEAINDTTIKTNVQNAVKSGFSALEQTGSYMPLIVLAVVIALVLSLVLGFTAFGNQGRGGSAL